MEDHFMPQLLTTHHLHSLHSLDIVILESQLLKSHLCMASSCPVKAALFHRWRAIFKPRITQTSAVHHE